MSLKEKIEKSPWSYILGIVITTIGLTSSILIFLLNDRIENIKLSYQNKLDECSNTLSSINRGIGKDADLMFNIQQVFVNSSDILKNASKLKYYNSEQFYTLADSSYWVHSTMYTHEMARAYGKLDKKDYSTLIKTLKQHKAKIHYWNGGDYYCVQGDSIFPFCLNTTLGIEKFHIDSLALQSAEVENSDDIGAHKTWVKKQILSMTLLTFVNQQSLVAKNFPATIFEIQDLRCEANFIYLKSILTVKNIVVNKTRQTNFYIRSETIGLLCNDYVYVITIVDPLMDKLGSNSEINKWLNNLRIIID
jgi:hypothetical protein